MSPVTCCAGDMSRRMVVGFPAPLGPGKPDTSPRADSQRQVLNAR